MVEELKAAFSERLHIALNEAGVVVGRGRGIAVARALHVSGEAARKWLSGEAIPAMEMAVRLSTFTRVSIEWLLTGRGQKSPSAGVALVDSDAPGPDAIEIARQYQQLMPMHQELVANLIKQALEAQRALAEAQGGIADTVAEVMVAKVGGKKV